MLTVTSQPRQPGEPSTNKPAPVDPPPVPVVDAPAPAAKASKAQKPAEE